MASTKCSVTKERPAYRHPYLPSARKFYLLNGSVVDPSTQNVFYLGNGQGLLGTPYLLCTLYRVLLFGWCRILCNGQEQLVRTNSLLLLLLLVVFYTALQQTKQLPSNVLILVFFIIVFGYFLSLKRADSPPFSLILPNYCLLDGL